MTLSSAEISELVDVGRDYVASKVLRGDPEQLAPRLAEALVQLAEACVVGAACDRHGGVVHGREAEELRVGIEQITGNISDVCMTDAFDVLRATRKSLTFLLDRTDARDSLAFCEATDGRGPAVPLHAAEDPRR